MRTLRWIVVLILFGFPRAEALGWGRAEALGWGRAEALGWSRAEALGPAGGGQAGFPVSSEAGPLVARVILFGNEWTRPSAVLRELGLKAGSPAAEPDLRRARARLERLGWFRSVDLSAVHGPEQGRCDLLVLVTEKGRWTLDPSLGHDALFGWTAGAAVGYRNGFGRRQALRAGFKTGGVDEANASWSEPAFGGPLRLFAEARAAAVEYRYRYPDYRPSFRFRSERASFALGRSFGRYFKAGFRREFENASSNDGRVTFSKTGKDALTLSEGFGRLDLRDKPSYPRSGLYAEASLQRTSDEIRFRFSRVLLDLRGYRPLRNGGVAAFQALFQRSTGDVPVYKRIHSGGSSSLRGFDTGMLAGDRLWTASAEFRFPILFAPHVLGASSAGTFGVLFADAGSVWFSGEKQDALPDHGAAGFGVHWIWDDLVLRAEAGLRENGGLFFCSTSGVKF